MMKSKSVTQLILSISFLVFLFLGSAPLAESFSDKQPANLFINVIVHDPSDAISNKLGEKLGKSRLPGFMKIRMTKKLSDVAKRVVKPTMVAEKMAAKMTADMPVKMKGKGITATVEEHYREANYFVLLLQIKNVDAAAMAEGKMESKSLGARVQKMLAFVGAKNKDRLESYLLPGLIEKKLPAMMTEMMAGKMAEKGVKAEAKVLPEAKQAKYFDEKIRQIRKAAIELDLPLEGEL